MASAGVRASGMARLLDETLTKPLSVTGQVAQPLSRIAENHAMARA